jgi:hypothetical protein
MLLALVATFVPAGCGGEEPPPTDLVALFEGVIPDEPVQLFLLSVHRARSTPYGPLFAEKLARLPGFAFGPDDMDAILIANDKKAPEEPGYNNVTIVVRTRRDRPLSDAFKSHIEHESATVLDLPSVVVRGGFFPSVQIVRLDPRTFLYYRGVRKLEDLVERSRSRRPARLDAAARGLLASARTHDACLLQIPPNAGSDRTMDAGLARSGIVASIDRVRFGDPVEYAGTIVAKDPKEAEDRLEQMTQEAKRLEELSRRPGEEGREAAEDLRLMRTVQSLQDGSRVEHTARLSFADFRALLVGDGLPVVSRPAF